MRWVPVGKAKTLAFVAPKVPDAPGTFTVYDVSGGILQVSEAAGHVVTATTLTAPAPAGSRTLTVASTAGFVAGREYLVGGPTDTGGEFVRVSKVTSATTLALAMALRTARSSGDALASTRVTFAVGTGATAVCGRNFRIEWEWASGGESQDPITIPFDVTRYSPVSSASVETVRTLDALVGKRIPDGTWMPAVLATAWDMLLRRVAAKIAPGGVAGTIDLTIPHGYLTLVLLLEPGAGDPDIAAHLARLETRFGQELDAAMGALATDHDQDGDAKTGEPGWGTRSISFIRS